MTLNFPPVNTSVWIWMCYFWRVQRCKSLRPPPYASFLGHFDNKNVQQWWRANYDVRLPQDLVPGTRLSPSGARLSIWQLYQDDRLTVDPTKIQWLYESVLAKRKRRWVTLLNRNNYRYKYTASDKVFTFVFFHLSFCASHTCQVPASVLQTLHVRGIQVLIK